MKPLFQPIKQLLAENIPNYGTGLLHISRKINLNIHHVQVVPENLYPVCLAAVEELHRPGFKLEFETLYESI